MVSILDPEFVPIRSHTLQAIHIICFCHRSVAHHITYIKSTAIATGIQNTLGNKGAVVLYMTILDTTIAVVNAHFAAGQKAVKKRNQNFHTINRSVYKKLNSRSTINRSVMKVRANSCERTDETAAEYAFIAPSPPPSPSPKARRWSRWYNDFDLNTIDTLGSSGDLVELSQPDQFKLSRVESEDQTGIVKIDEIANRVIFMGDLNYRINGDR